LLISHQLQEDLKVFSALEKVVGISSDLAPSREGLGVSRDFMLALAEVVY